MPVNRRLYLCKQTRLANLKMAGIGISRIANELNCIRFWPVLTRQVTMREIITVAVGQAGNQVNSQFWRSLTAEHGIDINGVYTGYSELQKERLDVYFTAASNRYVPRAVLVDLGTKFLVWRENRYFCNHCSLLCYSTMMTIRTWNDGGYSQYPSWQAIQT